MCLRTCLLCLASSKYHRHLCCGLSSPCVALRQHKVAIFVLRVKIVLEKSNFNQINIYLLTNIYKKCTFHFGSRAGPRTSTGRTLPTPGLRDACWIAHDRKRHRFSFARIARSLKVRISANEELGLLRWRQPTTKANKYIHLKRV